jgi:hypothetical protein
MKRQRLRQTLVLQQFLQSLGSGVDRKSDNALLLD